MVPGPARLARRGKWTGTRRWPVEMVADRGKDPLFHLRPGGKAGEDFLRPGTAT